MNDAEWVTPQPPIDLATEFPEMAPLARTTTRLHPRRGTPTVSMSSAGGELLWPADEPWPTCTGPHFGFELHDEEPVAAVPLLQLYKRDVPQLPFPDGTNLLQVLWCPREEHPWTMGCGPKTVLVWRDSTRVGEVLAAAPRSAPLCDRYLPQPCVVHPEPGVVEYPSAPEDLPETWAWSMLDDFEDRTGWTPSATLFSAPGTKVGGWPDFCQESGWVDCDDCGRRMEYLLSVDESEWSGWERWIPLADEEQRSSVMGGEPARRDLASVSPLGVDLALGRMHLYYCRHCPDAPHVEFFDN